jgi:hypothetical protein
MKIHPRHHCLQSFLDRLVPESREFLTHLLSCESCREAALLTLSTGTLSRRPVGVAREPDEQATVLLWRAVDTAEPLLPNRVVAELEARRDNFLRERAEAPTLAAQLWVEPTSERRRVLAQDDRFHTLALASYLLEESRRRLPADPLEASLMAELGVAAVELLDPERYGENVVRDLRGRALAYLGDARRRSLDLTGAEQAFLAAEACLAGSGDPLETARFLELKAALLRDQRCFGGSHRLRERARSALRRLSGGDGPEELES